MPTEAQIQSKAGILSDWIEATTLSNRDQLFAMTLGADLADFTTRAMAEALKVDAVDDPGAVAEAAAALLLKGHQLIK